MKLFGWVFFFCRCFMRLKVILVFNADTEYLNLFYLIRKYWTFFGGFFFEKQNCTKFHYEFQSTYSQ